MNRMIGDAKLQLNHGGDPATGPGLPSKAVGFGSTGQERGQTGQLCGGQPPGDTGRWSVPKGFRSALAAALDPLADGGFADAHGLGDVALGPTLLLEMPGSKTSRFLPGVR
jgi:hypothetical protein